jgi:hypothetical protein
MCSIAALSTEQSISGKALAIKQINKNSEVTLLCNVLSHRLHCVFRDEIGRERVNTVN